VEFFSASKSKDRIGVCLTAGGALRDSHTLGRVTAYLVRRSNFFSRTPGPPPFSSTNATLANLKVFVSAVCHRGDWVRFAKKGASRSYRFCFGGLRRRTPGPPPFSSMNSTPADSRARRIAWSLAAVSTVGPSANSALRMVATPTEDSFARSSARQRINDRAALIWALVKECFMVDSFEDHMIYDISSDIPSEIAFGEETMRRIDSTQISGDRRTFIGGSDARIIMGNDEAALIRLWKQKRGEVEPEDLSGDLLVQLGTVTEDLNRQWYERNTGNTVGSVQRRLTHPIHKWMAATLDGLVEPGGVVFEAKFMLPWTFSEEVAAQKHMAQLQHNMWVVHARTAALSIITGGGKWVEVVVRADPLYQHLLLTAEKKFWRCVQSGEEPRLFGVEPPRPRLEAVRSVDMSSSNSWAEFSATYRRTRQAYLEHEDAKAELKKLVPEDAKEAFGHGIKAKRSKSGAISFEIAEASDAPV
jgi:predicted phage-related endonuclease